jgi:hypothetical protein
LTFQAPPLYEYQYRSLFGDERYAVIEGATKVGKTFPALVWLIVELSEVSQRVGSPMSRNAWWCAPTVTQAVMAYDRMKEMFRGAGVRKTEMETHDTDRRISIQGLGHIWFKTGEKPDNLYGEDVWAVVLDEFTRQREEAWHACRSTLTATGGRVRFIGNKRGKGWGWKLARAAEQRNQDGDKSWAAYRISALDAVEAGLMPQSELDDARKSLPDSVFRQLYLCEDTEDGSNPFGLGHIRGCIKEQSKRSPVVFGIDLAKSEDYTVVVGLDEVGDVCRFDRWQGLSWDQTEARILSIIQEKPALVDSSGVGDPIVERLHRERPRVEGFKFTGGRHG